MDAKAYNATLAELRKDRDQIKKAKAALASLEEARDKKIRTLAGYEKANAERIAPAAGLRLADIARIAPALTPPALRGSEPAAPGDPADDSPH
ncbi:hypothetical protein ACIP27_40100, partial [Streptomyces hydrogenans]